ncbi:Response regulator receiver domain-containing protein [Marinospirillum celere]|uniref:Response regulator receiver domain-containing protein n=1 Tax=Marinospirillum celere TaxID=1122252 RepID=A0A1I1EKZ3_9GAMM|nr:response regulator [Marinospirillum celere]SFB87804.1 Response regulator receiver domain-containing protein [Marinospirillum celere]
MQILVVDDDALAAEMIGAVLESEGYQPLLAESAIEGMEQLNANPDVGLVISDMNMPLINGIEFFRELREQGNQLPFILLTGDDPKQAQQQEAGLDACILKDFNLDTSLPGLVSEVLNKR